MELREQLKKFKKEGKILEAERLKRRSEHDLALIREVGYCNGIENYSRHFDRRKRASGRWRSVYGADGRTLGRRRAPERRRAGCHRDEQPRAGAAFGEQRPAA